MMNLPDIVRTASRARLDYLADGVAEVLRHAPADTGRAVRNLVQHRAIRFLQQPDHAVLGLARRLRPRLRVGEVTLVTRAEDVLSLLQDDAGYRVEPYARTMDELLGPFALGRDGAEHRVARARLDQALGVLDLDRVRCLAQVEASRLIAAARPDGRLDLVTDYLHPLLTATLESGFGLPPFEIDPHQPHEQPAVWASAAFEAIFLNGLRDRAIAERGRAAVQQLSRWAAEASTDPATVAGALAAATNRPQTQAHHQDQALIDLVGLVVGMVATVTESVVTVVDHLLSHPGRLAAARTATDDAQLLGHALECLRLQPTSPGLVRTPAGGGVAVLASTVSAMRDPGLVGCPHAYRPGRPPSAYLHFGHGPHRCPGEPLAAVLIPLALRNLLHGNVLRRTAGDSGRLDLSATLPTRFVVGFAPPGGAGTRIP